MNHVFVLGQNGGWLDTIGSTGDIAPNETIQSVRFVGTKGYVTTYRQVDPLFVFDLSNPKAPNQLGELTIAGFSEYMQPIDDNHLITIGRDATNELQLQIFDVTNPAAPNRTFATTYTGGNYASSDAEYDHKAFTYFADKGLLAIPFYSLRLHVDGRLLDPQLARGLQGRHQYGHQLARLRRRLEPRREVPERLLRRLLRSDRPPRPSSSTPPSTPSRTVVSRRRMSGTSQHRR